MSQITTNRFNQGGGTCPSLEELIASSTAEEIFTALESASKTYLVFNEMPNPDFYLYCFTTGRLEYLVPTITADFYNNYLPNSTTNRLLYQRPSLAVHKDNGDYKDSIITGDDMFYNAFLQNINQQLNGNIYTTSAKNKFNNNYRFTGVNGGGCDATTYYSPAGVPTTIDVAFPKIEDGGFNANYIIDHTTGLAWLNAFTFGLPANTSGAIGIAEDFECQFPGGIQNLDDWRLPSIEEYISVFGHNTRAITFAPFNLADDVLISSTPNSNNPSTTELSYNSQTNTIQNDSKTLAFRNYILVRTHYDV